jgi:3-dehydroquinate synthase
MTTVDVNVSKKYSVHIGAGLLGESGARIARACGGDKAVIVSDDIVNGLYGAVVEQSLKAAGYEVVRFVFKNSEQSKNIETYTALLYAIAQGKLTRGDVVVGLGGGVTGDLAGFAAGTYLRGVKLAQLATTLLAMVDSSVGGKTAVNLPSGKNQAGVFYQPDVVLCDYSTLDTLTEETYLDGCAEIIKHAIIADRDLFELLKNPLKPRIEAVIARNIEIKRDIVAKDETDLGIRQLLNFGHTVAHGIEKHSNYQITHGKAVAIGMVMESRNTACYEQILEMVKRYNLPFCCDIATEKLINAAFSDKKRKGDAITMIVPEAIGKCELKSYTMDEFAELIRA